MDEYSCLASDVDCYNVAPIHIGAQSTVSQGAYLCTASHDITDPKNHLITEPIVIQDQSWVGAKAFIGMGVTIGNGAVIGSGAVVTKDVPPYAIVAGVPAKILRYRFDEEIINRLQKSEWWKLSDEKLKQLSKLFDNPEAFLEAVEK